jgi:hypothetical protein
MMDSRREVEEISPCFSGDELSLTRRHRTEDRIQSTCQARTPYLLLERRAAVMEALQRSCEGGRGRTG